MLLPVNICKRNRSRRLKPSCMWHRKMATKISDMVHLQGAWKQVDKLESARTKTSWWNFSGTINKTPSMLPVPKPAARLFEYLWLGLGAVWITKLLCDNPLVYTPKLEQTDECRLCSVKRHHILKKDPEWYEMDRTESKTVVRNIFDSLFNARVFEDTNLGLLMA